MLGKLLALLVAGKGGGLAAATIVAGATTMSVMTTSPDVQDAVNALSRVTSPGMSQLVKDKSECPDGGQPVVVAQRNAADKLLRDAHQGEHKRLVGLRGRNDVDHQAANEILRTADRDLRSVLTHALNDVARETLGREGHLKVEASPSPTGSPAASPTPTASPAASPTGSPAAAETPKPTCAPKPSASPSPASTTSPAASPTGSPAAEERGRLAVANRVTLDAKLRAIVDKAKADMKRVVDKAASDVAALAPTERGKPAEKGKPEPGKAEEKKSTEHGKPSERARGKPSTVPGKP